MDSQPFQQREFNWSLKARWRSGQCSFVRQRCKMARFPCRWLGARAFTIPYGEPMTRHDILMTAPMHPTVVQALEDRFTLHRLWEQGDPQAFLAGKGADIRGVATSSLYGRVNDTLLDHLPALEIISSFGVGYDHVDVASASRRKVIVTHTPGVLDEEVADLTVGLLLATLRQIPQADRLLPRESGAPQMPALDRFRGSTAAPAYRQALQGPLARALLAGPQKPYSLRESDTPLQPSLRAKRKPRRRRCALSGDPPISVRWIASLRSQ